MNGAIAWFARNPVGANLLMLAIVAGGLMTLPTLRQEVFPEFELDLITVSVVYPGASPEEVEEGITVRIEEQIKGVSGIKELTSVASEGAGVVTAELLEDANASRILDEIKNRVDAIDTFPDEAEEPIVEQVVPRRQVINVAVSGEADERTLKRLGQQVRDEITALPGITQAELTNARPYEISIEVSEGALRRWGLTFDDVARAVRRSSLDLPGGSLKTAGGEILLRAKGQAYRGPDFERIVLLTHPDGSRVSVGDVARVVDGFEETDRYARFDGRGSVLVQVFRVGQENALDVASAVKEYVRSTQARMPEGIELTVWEDDSHFLRARRDTLMRNAATGFAMVMALLALFLRLRLAFWVGIGVPISFLGAIWLMPAFDVSINMVTLFAFILVLGILVDDAIVTGENIHTHQTRDHDRLRAAIRGAQEVAIPVTFGVLTSVAAFVPMMLLPGVFGKVFAMIPIIVIAALFFSLVESKLVLPSHLSHGRDGGETWLANPVSRAWRRLQERIASGLQRSIDDVYRPLLERCLRWRYLTAATAASVLLLAVGWVAGGWIPFTFFPRVEGDNVVAMVTLPQGTPVQVTERAVLRLEQSFERVREELDASRAEDTAVRHVLASVGEQPYGQRQGRASGPMGGLGGASAGHLGEVNVELVPAEQRSMKSVEVARRWREVTGPIPDAEELVFTSSIFGAGDPIRVQLRGPDLEELRVVAGELKAALAEYPGVFDVTDSFRGGKQELKLRIQPGAEALGLSLADLARQVRQAFYGEEAQRIQRGRDDVAVMVRYPAEERRSLGDLENMRIRLPDGIAVPFGEVATAELGRGFSSIRRTNGNRVIDVTADVDLSRANANQVLADLRSGALPRLLRDHPSVSYSFEGEQREQRETLGRLGRLYALSMIAIFTLLAVPLGSYVQPLIIMAVIPMGFVGSLIGHLLMGIEQLSMVSVIGLVAASGVVVNDSLVLVAFVNERRNRGVPLVQALRDAGAARFRPILLTSLTTFVGLLPMMLERSVQAQFLIPMAVSLAFGVLFATVITLLLVPSAYLILEDLRRLPAWLAARLAPPVRRHQA